MIEFPLMEELNIRRTLASTDIQPLSVVPVRAPLLAPVDLFQSTDFGDYLMVPAGNMKMELIDTIPQALPKAPGGNLQEDDHGG